MYLSWQLNKHDIALPKGQRHPSSDICGVFMVIGVDIVYLLLVLAIIIFLPGRRVIPSSFFWSRWLQYWILPVSYVQIPPGPTPSLPLFLELPLAIPPCPSDRHFSLGLSFYPCSNFLQVQRSNQDRWGWHCGCNMWNFWQFDGKQPIPDTRHWRWKWHANSTFPLNGCSSSCRLLAAGQYLWNSLLKYIVKWPTARLLKI